MDQSAHFEVSGKKRIGGFYDQPEALGNRFFVFLMPWEHVASASLGFTVRTAGTR